MSKIGDQKESKIGEQKFLIGEQDWGAAAAENYGIGHHWPPAANLHKHTSLMIIKMLL